MDGRTRSKSGLGFKTILSISSQVAVKGLTGFGICGVDLLTEHKMLLQRPLLVTVDTAIIGRPKDHVAALLAP